MGQLEGLGEASRADRVSYWMASADGTDRDALAAETEAEVAIVGGGIVGLTTALLLAESTSAHDNPANRDARRGNVPLFSRRSPRGARDDHASQLAGLEPATSWVR